VDKATREAAYPVLCGEHYSPQSKDLGQACRFDQECVNNTCSSGDCGSVGICTCNNDAECGTGRYCGYALNEGKCQNKKAKGASCLYGRECLSGSCSWLSCR
jgi:hypothetical protein